MPTHSPVITRLAVLTLCLCSAVLGAAVARDITATQYRCASQREQSPTQSQLIRFLY